MELISMLKLLTGSSILLIFHSTILLNMYAIYDLWLQVLLPSLSSTVIALKCLSSPEFTSVKILPDCWHQNHSRFTLPFLTLFFTTSFGSQLQSPFPDVVPVCSSLITMCATSTVLTTALPDHSTLIKDNILQSTIQLFTFFFSSRWLLMTTLHILKQNWEWEKVALIPGCSIFSLFPSLS